MKKTLALLLPILLLAGCMSVPSKRYFQILIQTTDGPPVPTIEKALYLEPVRVDPLYDDTRIVYRVSPFEIKYYTYGFWAKRPDALFREAMADFFGKRAAFRRITTDVLQGDPELLLRSNIRILEEVDSPDIWHGRLAMTLEFLDFKSGRSLLLINFDRKMPLFEKQVRALPAALSKILEEELVRATAELARVLEEK
jgi:ABC-type uncharacterized transport system auxiliary subunit